MASPTYSFIDIAVMDEIRTRFAAGDALILLSAELTEVLWANGAGAALLGYPSIEAIIGASPGVGPTATRQIAATGGFPDIGRDRHVAVRLTGGLSSTMVHFLATGIAMPGGERAILLAVPDGSDFPASLADRARTAIGGFDEDGQFIAMLGSGGE